MPIPTRTPHQHESRLDWLKRVHPLACPECRPTTPVPQSRLQLTAWCPTCARVWKCQLWRDGRMIKVIWYHEADHATAQELIL